MILGKFGYLTNPRRVFTRSATFALENTGGAGSLDIVEFLLVIKEPNRGIDPGNSTFNNAGATGATVQEPTGTTYSQTVVIDYSDFQNSETHTFALDFDDFPTGDQLRNYREILFNNGGDDNAMLTVSFAGGHSLMLTMPDVDDNTATTYTFSQSGNTETISEPAVVGMIGAGLFGLAWARRRR